MDKIKELTDFYVWMQENDYNHNIRARVERKAEIYVNNVNVGQKLPIHNVSYQREQLIAFLRQQSKLHYITIYENDFEFANKLLKAINCS